MLRHAPTFIRVPRELSVVVGDFLIRLLRDGADYAILTVNQYDAMGNRAL
jgi:hypothetical protein